ncbi:phthioceranic/hydroxyphthioceranic acid synthase-like [Ruditapes philippinarum]|uniref:phthioceranic/hydroxyphthioceranic acid synthase-like n=1 Tax=Ruditapes philippinarum TaxID=129788 RepID=UPI00295A6E9D|nr:phthioceranic/hydroxyphthioceranic acid synthase-like [Ruditapes philippinarum]
MEDIAVIGLGCRFPGADNAEEYWRVLVNGENHITDIPKERWDNEAFYSNNKDEPGKSYVNKAGFINGHDEWDNKLFGISDSEAMHIDPQQRQVLECTHMALEDAGLTRTHIKGTETGVYIGVMNDDYKRLSSFDHEEDTNYSATGMSATIISARVSYVYDLRGPCMVVDTACSSSMLAIHIGCQAIRSGDCEMAVCGGVSSIITPDQFITLCKARMLSPTGQCQSFCDTADGYGRGEGCGIVILKSYSKALRDKNNIWGIIKTGSNQDGHVAQPITAPSGQQQEALMRKIYSQYNIDPTCLQYIEAHGTGTAIGDPTEINAIGRFLDKFRSKIPPDKENITLDHSQANLRLKNSHITSEINRDANTHIAIVNHEKTKKVLIGSVKSNIGHLESAAGVAGLIKVLLMMKHEKIVPSLHVKKDKSNINKKIELERYGLEVSVATSNWIQNDAGEMICCVNCFGFGGSNTHAVVIHSKEMMSSIQKLENETANSLYNIICLSGVSKAALKDNIEALVKDIASGNYMIQDISYTSVYHRDHFPYRSLVFGITDDSIKQQLRQKLLLIDKIESTRKTRIAFIYCGVGTTWKGMCREMMSTQEVFRKAVSNIDKLLQPLTGWSIADKFRDDTDYSDPFLNHIAIFCTQVALTEQWKSMGIVPETVIGQSVGEVAASYASGALCLKDAVQVIFHRSKILANMTGGKMMVVGNIEVSRIESLCKSLQDRVTIAVFNSPVSCTVSGDEDAVTQLKNILEEMIVTENTDIMIRVLSVQCAYHSHHMDPCIEAIANKLALENIQTPSIDQISTVTGELYKKNDFQTGKYWAENIRKPVLFKDAIIRSADTNALNVFVEIGPRPVLQAHLANIMGDHLKGKSIPSMKINKENESLLTSLSSLFEFGVHISWDNIIPMDGRIVPVPRYIFQKTKMLHIPNGKRRLLNGNVNQCSAVHLFTRRNIDGTPNFTIHLDKENTPFVYDHFLFNSVLVPGATYVEAALEIGFQKSSLTAFEISVSVEFMNTCMPKNENECVIDVDVTDKKSDEYTFFVKKDGKLLAQGEISPRKDSTMQLLNIQTIKDRCQEHRTKDESYECLNKLHFRYGESLSVIQQSWASSNECIVEFSLPDSVMKQRKVTHLHPSVIDGLLQAFGILSSTGSQNPTLPKGVGSFTINKPPERCMYGYSLLVKSTPTRNHYNSLLLTTNGEIIAEIHDFYTKSVSDTTDMQLQKTYCTEWRETELLDGTVNFDDVSNERKSVIICSKRFRNFVTETDQQIKYIDVDTIIKDDAFKRLSHLRSIVYAPFFHIKQMENDGQVIYDSVKKSFTLLRLIIQTLKENNENIPVFVVTENVMGHTDKKGNINVCGSELWGMVRSAINEGAYENFNLIDISPTKENMIILETLVKKNITGYNEFLIENGKFHFIELLEVSDRSIPVRREVQRDISENNILKSLSATSVRDQFFDVKPQAIETNNVKPACKLLVESLCLHSPSVLPLVHMTNDNDPIWPNEEGYTVIGLEGIGYNVHDDTCSEKEKTKIVFCYPVSASTILSVPRICAFDLTTLPIYVPGMLTVGVILWNVVHAKKLSSNVCFIVDDKIEYCFNIIAHFAARLSVTCQIVKQSTVREMPPDKAKNIRILFVLTKITNSLFALCEALFPDLQEIVSIEEYITKAQRSYIVMKAEKIVVTILKTEDMFTVAEITKTVPNVYQSLKSIESNHFPLCDNRAMTHRKNQRTDVLTLPYDVIFLHDEEIVTRVPLMVSQKNVFRRNGCYILIGGLTGLGWEILTFLAHLGVKHIVAFSRSLPSKNKTNEIEKIKKRYECQVIHLQVDITNLCQVNNAFKKLKGVIGSDVVVRGIFHGGGVTRDTFLRNMTDNEVDEVLLPKVLGTWNLHLATLNMQLDFFVMHSSIVSIFGNQGQCNYGAGNSFQDAFAYYRRSLGLCGQSINWSTLSLGMATENEALERYLKSQGFHYLRKDEILECFMQAVMMNRVQIVFGKFDWNKIKEIPSLQSNPRKIEAILETVPISKQTKKDNNKTLDMVELAKLDMLTQKNVLQEKVKMKIAESFVLDENTLTENTRIVSLGIDSMAAISFTNAMFELTNVRIPIGTLFDESTTIEFLSTYILENIKNKKGSSSLETEKENLKGKQYLKGDITFMQKSLLDDFVRDPFSKNIMRQVDFEIFGLKLQKSDIKVVFNHLIKINPDLRRIFSITNDGSYNCEVVKDHTIDIEEVDFSSICETHSRDERDKVKIDITKDLPMKVMIGFMEKKTRIRVYVHAILGDLSGITNIFREIGEILTCHLKKEELPLKKIDMDPAEAIRSVLLPQMHELRTYWKSKFQEDIHPFTFSENINDQLDERNWVDIAKRVPLVLVDKVMQFLNLKGISMYHFIMCVYLALLHEKTGYDVIPLLTFADMRSYVSQLQSTLQSCSNAIPVIGVLRKMGTVSNFLKQTSDELNQMTQHGAYPYKLIEDEMQSEELKQHIGRHRVIMENMTAVNNHFKHEGVEIKIGNVFYKRHVYETTLHVEYDTKQRFIILQFGYNGKAVAERDANNLLCQLQFMIDRFIQNPSKDVKEILTETTTESSNVIQCDVGTPNRKHHEENKHNHHMDQLDKEIQDDRQTVVLTENFSKQTTQGWEHPVQLKLMTQISSKRNSKMLLTWGRGKKERRLEGRDISEVEVKKLNGIFLIVVKTHSREFIFKDPSLEKAMRWLTTFKQVDKEVKRSYQQ